MSAKYINPIFRGISLVLILLIALTAVPASPAATASSAKLGTMVTNIPVSSNIDWADPTNALTDDNTYASVLLPTNTYSDRLYVSGFQLNIPEGAEIEGIQVSLGRKAFSTGIRDVAIGIARNGEVVGTPKSVVGSWLTTEVEQQYGDASDKWGVTDWSPEDINADSFGVTVEVRNSSMSSNRAYIDYVLVTVTYSFTTTLTIDPLTVPHGESAALSATMSPAVAGKNITFTLNGAPACSAATNVLGVANCTPAAAFTQNAGTYNGYIGASFAGGGDYKASSAVGNLIVAPRSITITAAPDTKEYDGTVDSDGVPSITSGSLLPGHTAVWTQSFEDRNVGDGKALSPIGAVNDGNNGENYDITFESAAGRITLRRIVVTAEEDIKVYDGTPDSDGEPSITEGELAAGDTVEWSQAFENKHSGGRMIMPAGVIADGNNGENYYIVYQPDWGQITPLAITVSAVEDTTKVYDGTTGSAKKPQVTSGTLVSGDVPDFWQGFETQHVGTGKVLHAWGIVSDGNGGQNYTITFEPSEGSISPRPITVMAVDDEKVYDGTTTSDGITIITEGLLAENDTLQLTQAFEDKHVGELKTITPNGQVDDGNGGANYDVQVISVATGKITPRPITVTAKPDSKMYTGTPTSYSVPSITVGALFPYDTAVWNQAFENEHAGTNKTIIPDGEIQDGNNGDNYTVTFVNVSGSIIPRPITVTAVTDTKGYDGTTTSSKVPQVTDGELAIGDTGTWIQSFIDEHAGTSKTINPGGEIEDGNNGGNYIVTFKPVQTGVITQRAITVSAQNDAKVYDGTTASGLLPEITAGSLAAGDNSSFTQAFATRNAGIEIDINPSGKVNDGNNGGNYAVILVPAQGTITRREITVTAVTDTKTYDGTTTSSVDPEITDGALAAGDSKDFFQVFDTKNAGSGKTLTPYGLVNDGNNGENYTVTLIPVNTGVINTRAITVTADEITRQFGEEDPQLTFDVDPALAPGDSFAGELAREEGEAVSTYAILVGTLSAGDNYDITFVSADFIITQADQVITVTQHAPSSAIEGTTFEVVAESSSGLPVTYSSSGSCTNEGGVFSMTSGTGTCQVIINQAGDANYNPAPTIIEEVEAGEIVLRYFYIPILYR